MSSQLREMGNLNGLAQQAALYEQERSTMVAESGVAGNLNELLIVNFVHKQLREDLGQCLDAIYGGQPLEAYFETLLRVQARLIKWKKGFSLQDLYDMLIDKAHQKMTAIKEKLVSDMQAAELLRVASIERV